MTPPAPVRVVVAEDEALIRLDLAELLAEEGYAVVGQAGDGRTAVALAERLRPDVVILDVKMPVLDGLSAAEQITAGGWGAVVVLTAFAQRELVVRAGEAGAMAYLVKPFTRADLVPAVEVARSRYAQLRALAGEVGSLQARLAARKVVERAKGELQRRHGLDEPAAFRWLQRAAMDSRRPLADVAADVLRELGADPPPRAPADPAGPAARGPAGTPRSQSGDDQPR